MGISMGVGLVLAVTSAAAPPTLSLTATDAVIGETIGAAALLSEGSNASGEISFEVFGPGDPTCAGPALAPAPASASVTGDGEYSSGDFTPTVAGTYRWSAHYSGDGENPPADATCEAVSVVDQETPLLSGTASGGVVVDNAIHDEVTLTGGHSPTGEVVFRVYGPADPTCVTALSTESVQLQGGQAVSGDFVPQQAGEYRWTASYEGDENNKPVSLACGSANQSSLVEKDSPTLSGVATSGVAGSAITDAATLAGGFAPGGQLLFRAYGPDDPACAGAPAYEATVAVSGNGDYSPAGFSPGAGAYRWTLEYSGDGNNEPFVLPCGSANQTSTVGRASPSLAGVASDATVGTPITDSVTLSGGVGASGQLLFRAYGPADPTCANAPAYEATVPVSGNGGYSPPGFAPVAGSYRWTVEYSGDGNNEAASLGCGSPNQDSVVSKAAPTLAGIASSAAAVGLPITDSVTLAGGVLAGGQLVFRAYGPADPTCATAPRYEATVPVNGNGVYSPAGFSPGAGLYHWTVEYSGDANNEPAGLPCGAANQASAVGMIDPVLTASAASAAIGQPVTATASLREGAIPGGLITFRAFPPSDANCSGTPAFSWAVNVTGNGSYSTGPFVPAAVGTYRWTVSYSGDPNHAPVRTACGTASSAIAQAKPSITSQVDPKLTVGTAFQIAATVKGGYAPAGKVSFRIYGPGALDCARPLSVNTVTLSPNGTVRSDPFVAQRPGRYTFVASYSGDAANQGANEACGSGSAAAEVTKRTPKVRPNARLKGDQIAIRARLSGAAAPSGAINFRLYRPGDTRCKGRPAFSGGVTVKSNGSYLLAQYLATKEGVYRLSVGYSGDQRNRRFKGSCGGSQQIPVG